MKEKTKYIYMVVRGDYLKYLGICSDKFYQFAFDSLDKAQQYVLSNLQSSVEEFETTDYNITDSSEIRVDKCYECYNRHLGYEYIVIRQYYLL